MRLKPGTYFDRDGRRVEIAGVTPEGWAYTSTLSWFYADTGESAIKHRPFKHFPCPSDLIERMTDG